MKHYKEFQGKTLDDAIGDACAYFGVVREKLEIDILSDAKTGIFGLVGMKKATIRACRVDLSDAVNSLLGADREKNTARRSSETEKTEKPAAVGAPGVLPAGNAPSGSSERKGLRSPAEAESTPPARSVAQEQKNKKTQERKNTAGNEARRRTQDADRHADAAAAPGERKRGKHGAQHRADAERTPACAPAQQAPLTGATPRTPSPDKRKPIEDSVEAQEFFAEGREELPDIDPRQYDQELLFSAVKDVILRLVEPIVGSVPCSVHMKGKGVCVTLDCGDSSGLLVGRDGQTLASVQYLASRILARKFDGLLRLQIDTGNYRERQDDKIKEMARSLAERVKQTSRSQSTRPLSAYQRRIVHLALEHDNLIQTYSKGEGAQRRVVIQLRRSENAVAGEVPTDALESAAVQNS